MALEVVEHADSKLVQVAISGKLSAEDYEVFEPAISAMIERVGKIKILFVMTDFHGWELGAIWEDIKFATKHCGDISKIAMVGETAWERWMATICKPFTLSKIKYFGADQLDDATQWLAED